MKDSLFCRQAKRWVRAAVQHDRVWTILDRTVLRAARYAEWMRRQSRAPREGRASRPSAVDYLASETVLHGPFQGMVYRNDVFCCSAIPPKLLGSYEREIHGWLEEIANTTYEGVVDVGCAEGYYAVGLALRMPDVPVYGYDINEAARRQCRALAEAKNVEDRIHLRNYCDPEELGRLVLGRQFLVIADCEGYEKTLFSADNLEALRQSDILIEVHDFMDLTILPYLRELLSATHDIRETESIDDVRKLDLYDYPELRHRDIHERFKLTAEWRQRIMKWMFLTPKAAGSL